VSGYGVRDVERVLKLSRGTIRGLVRKGFVKPTRGPRSAWRFSFKDLVVMRAARSLYGANIPARRISRSLRELRRRLPEEAPLAGLQIAAIGENIVVRDGNAHWQAETGQYLLKLDVEVKGGALRVVDRRSGESAEDWFNRAVLLEESDRQRAVAAYQRATALDPQFADAYLNWGHMLHEMGALSSAERVYRTALRKCRRHALLSFNLGVLLEDLGQPREAVRCYEEALAVDPALADCHFNLARLYDEQGDAQRAFRHYARYRKLTT
jgi:tetratricopeptide (TPR) repeat protein